MSWLAEFYEKHPEYRRLRIAKRAPHAIHFELELGIYEAHFSLRPIHARTRAGVWLPESGLLAATRMALRVVSDPGARLKLALLLPFATVFNGTLSADTYIYSSNANTNYGGAATGYLSAYLGDVGRLLVKFDLTSLPSSAVISSTTVGIDFTVEWSNAASTAGFYRQKRAWTGAGATWNKYDGANSWQTAGGFGANDCEQSSIGGISIPDPMGTYQYYTGSLTASAKSDLDLGNGWLIKRVEGEGNFTQYAVGFSENGTPPTLSVTYTLPATGQFLAMGKYW